jgi:hypothetical protein
MQQRSNKHAPREKNKFCQDINMQKMCGFLDEKYTPGNIKSVHAKNTNIVVKHATVRSTINGQFL